MHLVDSFYEIYITMDGSMNIKIIKHFTSTTPRSVLICICRLISEQDRHLSMNRFLLLVWNKKILTFWKHKCFIPTFGDFTTVVYSHCCIG